MIWFSCKKCNKVHGRSENSIGSTIFCDCGQGVVVPWESNAAEPAKTPESAGPRLKPMLFDPPVPAPPPLPAGPPRRVLDPEPMPAPRRDRRGPRDPNACLNHDNRGKQNSCADCGEGFCAMCLVTFQGKMLCGPCKNFRIRLLQKPLRITPLAWFSVFTALLTGPLLLCILPIGTSSWSWIWTFLALVPQGIAVLLGVLAWNAVEQEKGLGGRSLAIAGMLTGSLTAFLVLLLNFYGPRFAG